MATETNEQDSEKLEVRDWGISLFRCSLCLVAEVEPALVPSSQPLLNEPFL